MVIAAIGVEVRTLTSTVYLQLRSEILSVRLAPGEKLNVLQLSKRFAVSLGAVREALSRLMADGLVEAIDRRGFSVSSVSVEDLADVTRTRIDIEGLALRRSIEGGDEKWLALVGEAYERLDLLSPFDSKESGLHNEAWIEAHKHFHRSIVSACGSAWLLKFGDILHERSERYRRLSIPLDVGVRDIRSEHKAIADAVSQRDTDAAVDALSKHYNSSMHHALSLYSQLPQKNRPHDRSSARDAAFDQGS